VLVLACADKPPPVAANGGVRLGVQFQARVAPQVVGVARKVDVRFGYDRGSGERVALAAQSVDVATGEVSIATVIDLSGCMADDARAGSPDACPLRISIALRDTALTALDSLELGPYEAVPGRSLAIPAVELAVRRFTVRDWVADDGLRLAPSDAVPRPNITGLVTGAGAPTIYSVTTTATGGALLVYEAEAWRRIDLGFSDVIFTDVAMVSPTEGWLTAFPGSGGTGGIFRFDGAGAVRVSGVSDSLLSIAVSPSGTPRFIAATARGAIWHGDGTSWTRTPLVATEPVGEVCVSSDTVAFAVGGSAETIWRWNGTAWLIDASAPIGTKAHLQCLPSGQAFVRATGVLYQWSGIAWTPFTTVGMTGATSAFAAGASGDLYSWVLQTDRQVLYRFGGATWQQVAQTAFSQGFRETWVDPRGGRAYAASVFGRIERYEAGTGQRTTIAYSPDRRDIVLSSATSGFAVGWNLFLARWNGTRWTVDTPPSGTPQFRILHGVWSDGPNNAWAVGNASTILRWNGTAWSVVGDVFNPIAASDSYWDVWGSGSTVIIAGSNGILRCTGPTACINEAAGSGILNSVWGSGLNNVFAVGNAGRIVRYDGAGWITMASPTNRTLVEVWGTSPSDVWAIGDSVLVHYDGAEWASVPMTGVLASLRSAGGGAGWGSGPNDVYVASASGGIARYDGIAWSLLPVPTTNGVIAMTGVAGYGALALMTSTAAPSLLRGIGPNGGLSAPTLAPLIWP
jgi:hypothetical protein